MIKFITIIVLLYFTVQAYATENVFIKDLQDILQQNNYNNTLAWLNAHHEKYKEYMDGMPKNIATIAYRLKNINSLKAVLDFDKTLLQKFIVSKSGGHNSEPPTIFYCIADDDFEYVQLLMNLGIDPSITWEKVAFFPENLYSSAKSEKMKILLLSYHCPKYISVNNYTCKSIDNNINIRFEPNLGSKVLFTINTDITGKIDIITSGKEIVSGHENRWYHIIFNDGRSGWSFGQYYHVPWLEGM